MASPWEPDRRILSRASLLGHAASAERHAARWEALHRAGPDGWRGKDHWPGARLLVLARRARELAAQLRGMADEVVEDRVERLSFVCA